jgi:hypothetical protein
MSAFSSHALVDLSFDRVILNTSPNKCSLDIDCETDSSKVLEDNYLKDKYQYSSAKTFFAWEKITASMIKSKEQFDYLRTFSFDNVISGPEKLPNVLGLSPNSSFWAESQKALYVPSNVISLRFCLYPNYEHLAINSFPDSSSGTMDVNTESGQYRMRGKVEMAGHNSVKIDKEMSVCLKNNKDLLFTAIPSLVELLREKICKDKFKCTTKSDLNLFNESQTIIKFTLIYTNQGNSWLSSKGKH